MRKDESKNEELPAAVPGETAKVPSLLENYVEILGNLIPKDRLKSSNNPKAKKGKKAKAKIRICLQLSI